MLPRLLLEKTNTFERAFAALRMAEMATAFREGRPCDISIGREQGIETWDDFVIERIDGRFTHYQLKRQTNDFDTHPVDRGLKRGTTELQSLVGLDVPISKLAELSRTCPIPNGNPRREFTLEVAQNVGIKKDIRVSDLLALCADCRISNANVAGLSQRQAQGNTFDLLYRWLTTWCGFMDWAHILRGLSGLTVHISGTEAELNAAAAEVLQRCYVDPSDAHRNLLAILDDNNAYLGVITPKQVQDKIQVAVHGHIPEWTQYEREPTCPKWFIDGTHGRGKPGTEDPLAVVGSIWKGGPQPRLLRIVAVWPGLQSAGDPLPLTLARLALHLPPLAHAQFTGADVWQLGIKSALGETLGTDEGDIDGLAWAEARSTTTSGSRRELSASSQFVEEAAALGREFDGITWGIICEEVGRQILLVPTTDLRDLMEGTWAIWKADLSSSSNYLGNFLKDLMHPTAEGCDVQGSLRVGPRTAKHIATGIWVALLVAVALENEAGFNWATITNRPQLRIIANRRWSGPAGEMRSVRRLVDDAVNSSELLGKEVAKVLILSGVEAGESEFSKRGMADDAELMNSFAKARTPRLVITFSSQIRQLSRGSLQDVRTYLVSRWESHERAREQSINQKVLG